MGNHSSGRLGRVATLLRSGIVALSVGILALPASAKADQLTSLDYDLSTEHATIRLGSPEGLGPARIRTSRGRVRIWFPNIVNHPRLDASGDGHAVSELRVREGMDDTGLLYIDLGDRRRLNPEHIEINRGEGVVTIRIPRGDLAATPPPRRRRAPAADPQTQRSPAPAATPEVEDDADLDDDDYLEVQEAAPEATTDEGEEGTALALATLDEDGPGAMPYGLLLMVTLLLGGLYGVIRWLGSRAPKAPLPQLDIVASKRIGPRQQLIVIRALGEDHLLLMHGKQSQHIASVPVSDTPEAALEQMPKLASGMRIGGARALFEEDSGVQSLVPARTAVSAKEDEERFGARLLKLTGKRRDQASTGAQLPSDAVAGLMRLRRASGE